MVDTAKNGLSAVVDGLKAERERVRAELQAIRRKERQLASELEGVESAIAAITPKRKKPKESLRAAEAADLLEEILGAGPLAETELKKRLAERCAELERSRSGLRLDAVLEDSRFVRTNGAWRLRETTPGDGQFSGAAGGSGGEAGLESADLRSL